jgi:hypothetical protein
MDFQNALNTVVAELTPQPWDYTTHDGITTLTVVPAGLREDPGCAEVLIRIRAMGQFFDAEAGIPSRDLPAMVDALTGNRTWSYDTLDDVTATLTPFGGGGMLLTLSVDLEAEDEPQIHIPETQRLPFASALRRALDVARGWES